MIAQNGGLLFIFLIVVCYNAGGENDMTERQNRFRLQIEEALGKIDPQILASDPNEFWLIRSPYESIEFYAYENCLRNTAIALPLAVGLHSGTYRKFPVTKNGTSYKVPYVIHCLLVARMLADLQMPMSFEDIDILLASCLCHDMIEDLSFENGGKELHEKFGLDPRVYEVVKKVSKRKDFTEEEERAFFDAIQNDRIALLVKLSDRGHNVEDLYNRPVWKIHEYIGETRKYFIPMAEFGLVAYPEIVKPIAILLDKMVQLTQVAEVLSDRHVQLIESLEKEYAALKAENDELRARWKALWKGGRNG